MQRSTFALATRRLALAAAVAAAGLAATACSDDDNGGTGPAIPRMYNQVQRLGNPLVSEVLLSKRSHPTHGSIGPNQDAALVAPEVVDFLTTVAGRDPAYIQAIAPALIPDVLVVDTEQGSGRTVGLAHLAAPARRRLRRPQADRRRRGPRAHRGLRRCPRRRRARHAAAHAPTSSATTRPTSPARSPTSRRRTDAARAPGRSGGRTLR